MNGRYLASLFTVIVSLAAPDGSHYQPSADYRRGWLGSAADTVG